MPAPIRYTRQIADSHWVVHCKVCPKRWGRRNFTTEQAADDWWTVHVKEKRHLLCASRDGSLSAEQIVLARIFGDEQPAIPPVAPNERTGRVTSRPGVVRFRDNDNPRGDRG